MALKKIYIGSFGPALFDDTDDVDDVDGDFSGKTQQALTTDGAADIEGDLSVGGDLDVTGDADVTGAITVGSLKLDDTAADNTLQVKWNEDGAADYVLNLLVGGGTRSLTLNKNFTVGDGFNFTLTALGQANTLTLNEGFTIGDGHSGTLTFSAASKVLTVNESASISDFVREADFNADTFLYASSNDTPVATSPANVLAALTGHAAAAFSWNSQNLTSVGAIECGAITSTARLWVTDASLGQIAIFSGGAASTYISVKSTGTGTPWFALSVYPGASPYARMGTVTAHPFGIMVDDVTKAWIDTDGNFGIGIAASLAAKLHVDQSSTTAAIPVLTLDQGDVSEQCIKFRSDGVDRDISLFTVDVTGAPTLMWDESEDGILWNKELRVDGKTGIGMATGVAAQLHVDQAVADAAIPVLTLDQGDLDDAFINFIGGQGVGTGSIDTSERNTFNSMIVVEILGFKRWLKVYE